MLLKKIYFIMTLHRYNIQKVTSYFNIFGPDYIRALLFIYIVTSKARMRLTLKSINITLMRTSITKNFLLTVAGIFTIGATAQVPVKTAKKFGKQLSSEFVKCGSTEHEEMLQKRYPARANTEKFEQWLAPKVAAVKAQRLAASTQGTNQVVTIPVVVHIVHNGSALGTNENIADAQVHSQIEVLNQDFRRMMGTPGFNNNTVGADTEIQFCLAQRDVNGISTTGIIRHNLGTGEGWSMEEVDATLKPQTQWDPEQYLNIWVVDNVYIPLFGELAGYAQFPTNSGLPGLDGLGVETAATTDGVVIGHLYFGSRDIYPEGTYDNFNGSDKGRTTTHEVGHFFGLRHIWGDGGCNVDDFCDDTPVAGGPNQGCPVGTDSCPNSPGLDMIENYMDYTFDSCMNIFTQDQKDRMVAVLANSPRRLSLVTSQGCEPGVTFDLDGALNLNNVGTDCTDTFTPSIILSNPGNNVITSATIVYDVDGLNAQTYEWEGSLESGEQTTITLNTLSAAPGEHTFNAVLTLVNGVEDDFDVNNSIERIFNMVGIFSTSQIVITVMTDDYGGETIWAVLDSEGEPIASNIDLANPFGSVFYSDNQLYQHVVDVEDGECYTFTIIDLAGDGICCEFGEGYYTVTTAEGYVVAEGGDFVQTENTTFGINTFLSTADIANPLNDVVLYPNPSSSVINISIQDAMALPENYTVYNNLGQVINKGKINSNNFGIDISGYSNGIYFIKVDKGEYSKTLRFIKN